MNDLITVAMGEMHMVFEDQVMKAVQDVGIHVNKEELLKALELSKKLVRCEECKRRQNPYAPKWCYEMSKETDPDDFCSYGERKGE